MFEDLTSRFDMNSAFFVLIFFVLSCHQLVDLEIALKLLRFSRQLRQAGNATSVDYSSIQACSRSIIATLQSRSPTFDRLASVSAMLDEAVSPTSGLGLTEMWMHFFAPRTIEISLPEIRSLEYAAGQPFEGSNQHGIKFIFIPTAFSSINHSSTQAHSRGFIPLYTSAYEPRNC